MEIILICRPRPKIAPIVLIVQVTKVREVSGDNKIQFTRTTRKEEKTSSQLPEPGEVTAQKHVHMHRKLCTIRLPRPNALDPYSKHHTTRTNTFNYLSLPASRAELERTVACLLF